jgi:galactose mutarotase-like enzyme
MNRRSYSKLILSLCVVAGLVSAASSQTINVGRDHETINLLAKMPAGKLAKLPEGISITQTTLHGGKQEGVELIRVDNGKLAITVIPTRGMNILSVESEGVSLGWDSPVKDVVHPQYVDLESRGGLGWLEGFNEWMVRCGLEFAGHPGLDKFTTNTGDTAEMMLTLHGKIGNIPATSVDIHIDEKPPHRIRIRGVVHERLFYGPKLKLMAEVSTEPGSSEFTISDSVTNEGAFDQEFQLIYHGNFGAPLLGEGAKVHVAAKKIAPMNEHAGEAIDNWATYKGPTKGFIEEVYLFEPVTGPDKLTKAVLQNRDGSKGVSMQWSTAELPYLTIWKNTAAAADGYVTGIEPATGYPFNRSVERAAGRLPQLGPGETRKFTLEFQLHDGVDAVIKAVESVTKLQGDTKLGVQRKPPAVPH